ncbi:hypothetical protein NBH00_18595 [Paraconexibacter antarcticus]|uniref:Secreted protein n=1 Tax=Paraconexibacter antarcticus TaxID=2949664 RepID=A0ABY5DMV7_9ACTN|nr:hypothetical protein [Paraconexibacter antarcticus]UTI63351.1 hypothetical protein NBH00_18595 [Paraconexibacter antarcticus]
MTSAPARLAAFVALLVAAFGTAALLGGAVDPSGASTDSPAPTEQQASGQHDAMAGGGDHTSAASSELETATGAEAVPGLSVVEAGLRLVLLSDRTAAAGRTTVACKIVREDGAPVRAFDVEHAKRMHLIVVRRDLRGFQHLHPVMDAAGTWRAKVDLPRPGTYRVFADFRTADGKRTLGADLHVPGDFRPEPIPAPAAVAQTDSGLQVTLRRDGDQFAFSVRRGGRSVDAELQPYLGAKGHLVTLRAGDLAYLHTHPHGDQLAFEAELPSAGMYRLWVQFRLDGRVHTAAFTQESTT